MLAPRQAWEVYVGFFAGLWLARVVFDYALDIDGSTLRWLTVGFAVVGIALGYGKARETEPDAAVPPLALAAGAVALPILYLVPMPWGAVVSVALVALAARAIRAPAARAAG